MYKLINKLIIFFNEISWSYEYLKIIDKIKKELIKNDISIKRDWVNRLYTVINIPDYEDSLGKDSATAKEYRQAYIIRSERKIQEVFKKLNILDIVKITTSYINEDKNNILVIIEYKHLSFKKMYLNLILSSLFISSLLFFKYLFF